ncbi:hypothetical protein PVAP13_2KG039700 [Panicum virgatum]|uniref:Uncharacterized protein n=1 Tax=Panicum virgatum TaxID=38727 RepID=A0A8T0W1B5_PANVG|nr:hypothetical protein PVAP13_2KG039700 [Panicum virgatum]
MVIPLPTSPSLPPPHAYDGAMAEYRLGVQLHGHATIFTSFKQIKSTLRNTEMCVERIGRGSDRACSVELWPHISFS